MLHLGVDKEVAVAQDKMEVMQLQMEHDIHQERTSYTVAVWAAMVHRTALDLVPTFFTEAEGLGVPIQIRMLALLHLEAASVAAATEMLRVGIRAQQGHKTLAVVVEGVILMLP